MNTTATERKEFQDHFDYAEMRLKGGRYWIGVYRGIVFEVKVHRVAHCSDSTRPWDAFCGYIYLDSRMFSDDSWCKLVAQGHGRERVSSMLGICETFYEHKIMLNPWKGEPYEEVKVGWDHSHLWDYERGHVDGNDAVRVAREAIDHLAETCPDLLVFNRADGTRKRIADVAPADEPFTTLSVGKRRHWHDINKGERKAEEAQRIMREVSEALREVGARLTHKKKMLLAARIEGFLQ